jgi:hypothetical protein
MVEKAKTKLMHLGLLPISRNIITAKDEITLFLNRRFKIVTYVNPIATTYSNEFVIDGVRVSSDRARLEFHWALLGWCSLSQGDYLCVVAPLAAAEILANHPPMPYPTHWPKRQNGGNTVCDMVQGPCACGAWHEMEREAWIWVMIEQNGLVPTPEMEYKPQFTAHPDETPDPDKLLRQKRDDILRKIFG